MKALSIDIGASSGRMIVYDFVNHKLNSEETYRFLNGAISINNSLRWNIKEILEKIKEGLLITLEKYPNIETIGVDTWACDYVLLDKDNKLVFDPYSYRDVANTMAANKFLKSKKNSYYEVYKRTGIQYLPFNTIFQLLRSKDDISYDSTFLMIPDVINYYLSGTKCNEITNLSTTALYNPNKKCIDLDLLKLIGIDKSIFNKTIESSKKIGDLRDYFKKENKIEVVSVGSHDTASAIASIPLDEDSCYLSSGTWSLLGVELTSPLINEDSYCKNFTNEIGLENRTRFLKNIMGLFIVQELRKDFLSIDPHITFDKINAAVLNVPSSDTYIDIDDSLFSTPNNMLNKFNSYLDKTNQKRLKTIPEIIRCVYESMAMKYLTEFKSLEQLTNRKFKQLYVVGGGINSTLLNQLIADVLNMNVITLDSEGTALGNAIAQLIYKGIFKDLKDARTFLKDYYLKIQKEYTPTENKLYLSKYDKYLKTIK